jgi:RNA polymerase sigma-70 factor (ECF subfamily)
MKLEKLICMNYEGISDEELVRKGQLNCDLSEATAILYSRHSRFLENYLGRIVQNKELGEDLMQEAFKRVCVNIGEFNISQYKVKTWIFKIGYHLAINVLRERKKNGSFAFSLDSYSLDENEGDFSSSEGLEIRGEELNPEQKMIRDETIKFVGESVDKLSEYHRNVVVARHYGDMSYGEIAAVLGLNEGTVKSSLSRGRDELKEILNTQREHYALSTTY